MAADKINETNHKTASFRKPARSRKDSVKPAPQGRHTRPSVKPAPQGGHARPSVKPAPQGGHTKPPEESRYVEPSGKKQVMRGGNMLYPVPAVMVSCAREGEKPNIITVAWAGTVCSDPAMVSISVKQSRYSHDIIKESGEFVINLVNEKLVHAADWCGVRSGRDVDKFAYTWPDPRDEGLKSMESSGAAGTSGGNEKAPHMLHLTPAPAARLSAALIIRESPVNIECKVKQIIPLGSHDMFLAEVVAVDADQAYFDKNGRFDLGKAGLTAYSHGEYFALGRKLGSFGYSVRKK